MKRWHLFHNGRAAPHFGFGTVEQAQDHWIVLDGTKSLDRYAMTTLEEGEQPSDGAVIVDLDTHETKQDRYARK